MIIDFHTVVHPYEMRALRYDVDAFVGALDEYGIARAVIGAPFYYVTDYKLANAKVLCWMKRYPDRLIGFATINPLFAEEAFEELARCLDAGMMGLGEYHADLMDMPYDAPLSLKLLDKAVALKIPVLFHTGAKSLPGACRVAELFPEGKFVFAHIGDDKWRELLPFIAPHRHVSLCTSGTIFETGYFSETLKQVGEDRLIYGSDFVYIDPAIFIGMITNASIPGHVKEKIFWKNAARLLEMK